MSIQEEISLIKTGVEELRSFGQVVGGVFLLLWLVLWGPLPYFFGKGGSFPVLLGIGGVLVALGTLAPKVLKPVYIAWMSLAVVLGFFMTRVVLTLFFFLVLTPVGLFFRLIGRDALNRKIDRQAKTYWIEKEYPIADRSRYENFF